MGWSWRRSLSFGPVRLNFSRSGVGVSAGVRGARISTGPRGTFVHVGAGGFRYSRRLDDRPGGDAAPRRPRPGPRPTHPGSPAGDAVESIDPVRMLAASPDELLEEIRAKEKRISLVSVAAPGAAIFLMLGIVGFSSGAGEASLALVGLGLASLISLPWASWRDRRALTTRVHYDFDPYGQQIQEAIVRLLGALQRAHNVWSVRAETHHGDWKRNAGTGVAVDRQAVRVGWGGPPRLATNVRVGHLVVSGTTLYLFPDRLLIYGRRGIQAVNYTDLAIEHGAVNFVEENGVPRDAAVVGATWRFVNRDGGPDLRFRDNRQLPVVNYGVLDICSPSGLRLQLQLSTAGLAEGAATLLGLVQAAIKELRSRGAPLRPTTAPDAEGEDLPPLVAPAMKAVKAGATALEYRWMSALPEWAVPISWGLVFSLPAVALLCVIARGPGVSTGVFAGVALLISGCGVPVLLRDRDRSIAERRAAERQERKLGFRAGLIGRLRSLGPAGIDFEALVAESGLTRADADAVADDVYRIMADRVVADGVITPKERRNLERLAEGLQMDADRATRLDSEAASARYRQAVSDALADGVITPEESRMLDELRANLGVSEPGWRPGELVPRN